MFLLPCLLTWSLLLRGAFLQPPPSAIGKLRPPDGFIGYITFSPDNRMVGATTGHKVVIWNLSSKRVHAIVARPKKGLVIVSLNFTHDSKGFITTYHGEPTID